MEPDRRVVNCKNCIKPKARSSIHKAILDWFETQRRGLVLDEHANALRSCYCLVKPGGYLVFTVPDEDLYEQGVFLSRYNNDHKRTFTIYREKSWSTKSVNIVDLVKELQVCKVLRMTVVDTNYDYSRSGVDQTRGKAEAFIEVVIQKT